MFAHAIWADLCFANRCNSFRKKPGYLTHDRSIRSNVEGSLLLRSTGFQIHGEKHIEVLVDTIPDQHPFEVRIFLATRPDETARVPYVRAAGSPRESLHGKRRTTVRRSHVPGSDQRFVLRVDSAGRLQSRGRRLALGLPRFGPSFGSVISRERPITFQLTFQDNRLMFFENQSRLEFLVAPFAIFNCSRSGMTSFNCAGEPFT